MARRWHVLSAAGASGMPTSLEADDALAPGPLSSASTERSGEDDRMGCESPALCHVGQIESFREAGGSGQGRLRSPLHTDLWRTWWDLRQREAAGRWGAEPCPLRCPGAVPLRPDPLVLPVSGQAPQHPAGEGGRADGRPAEALAPPWEADVGEGLCALCRELLPRPASTGCPHVFCQACLAWLAARALASGALRCPLCWKSCSDGVLGAGSLLRGQQQKARRLGRHKRLWLDPVCLASSEQRAQRQPAGDGAVGAVGGHQELLSRTFRRLRIDTRESRRLREQEEERALVTQVRRRPAPSTGSQGPSGPTSSWPLEIPQTVGLVSARGPVCPSRSRPRGSVRTLDGQGEPGWRWDTTPLELLLQKAARGSPRLQAQWESPRQEAPLWQRPTPRKNRTLQLDNMLTQVVVTLHILRIREQRRRLDRAREKITWGLGADTLEEAGNSPDRSGLWDLEAVSLPLERRTQTYLWRSSGASTLLFLRADSPPPPPPPSSPSSGRASPP